MVQLKMSLHLWKMTLRLHKHSITNAHFCIIFSLFFWVDLLNCLIADDILCFVLFLFEYCGKTFCFRRVLSVGVPWYSLKLLGVSYKNHDRFNNHLAILTPKHHTDIL